MRSRCQNEKEACYPRYGGRGISVCPEWDQSYESFRNWAVSAGYREGLSIDRIDNAGNYEPSNCRWATRTEQSNNTRRNVMLTAFGETKNMTEWSMDPRCVVSFPALSLRIQRRGWDAERAITTPNQRRVNPTHCPHGHEYTEDNIYWIPDRKGNRHRRCATCEKARQRELNRLAKERRMSARDSR
jgi:hypothetical protein